MRLDLKIQDKALKEMKHVFSLVSRQCKFYFTKNNFFTIFARTLDIFLRVFANFTVSTEGYLESQPHEKLKFFLTLVNGWNLLPIVTESSNLWRSSIYLWYQRAPFVTKCLGKNLCNSERNQQKLRSLSSLKISQ